MDRGAWLAAIHGTAKSWTQLSDCTHAALTALRKGSLGLEYLGTASSAQSLSHVRLFETPRPALACNLPGSSVRGIFPGNKAGTGCHFLLQDYMVYLSFFKVCFHIVCVSCFLTHLPRRLSLLRCQAQKSAWATHTSACPTTNSRGNSDPLPHFRFNNSVEQPMEL